MNVDPAALLIGLAALIAALGAYTRKSPAWKWIFGACTVLAIIAILIGIVSIVQDLASNPPAEAKRPPVQAGPGPCTTGDEIKLDFQEETSGLTIPFAAEVNCPAPPGRTYMLIVERNFENTVYPYYYPKQHISDDPGTYRDSLNVSGSLPNSTRQIFVISIDNTQLDELRNTGPEGELVNWLPDSHKLASKKYFHTRTS